MVGKKQRTSKGSKKREEQEDEEDKIPVTVSFRSVSLGH